MPEEKDPLEIETDKADVEKVKKTIFVSDEEKVLLLEIKNTIFEYFPFLSGSKRLATKISTEPRVINKFRALRFLLSIRLGNDLEEKRRFCLAPPRFVNHSEWVCCLGPACRVCSTGYGLISTEKLGQVRFSSEPLDEEETNNLLAYFEFFTANKRSFLPLTVLDKLEKSADSSIFEPFLLRPLRDQDKVLLKEHYPHLRLTSTPGVQYFACFSHFCSNPKEGVRLFFNHCLRKNQLPIRKSSMRLPSFSAPILNLEDPFLAQVIGTEDLSLTKAVVDFHQSLEERWRNQNHNDRVMELHPGDQGNMQIPPVPPFVSLTDDPGVGNTDNSELTRISTIGLPENRRSVCNPQTVYIMEDTHSPYPIG